ncbi:hypothetical protein ACIQWR_39770 [Streptomyces sp. NPDC098789]|uniref:hypothetical protein n=1 Tax=Streptomyces sp. NPDC098789 TaxID=3366098 RepID=UPI003811F7B9
MRGRAASGFGQICATLLIGALAASAFVRPDYLLGRGGPLDVTHQAAIEVASITTNSYFGTGTSDPCDLVTGPGRDACTTADTQIARPVQDALTDALVVKPYMLLMYGRILDPKTDPDAYKAHLDWITTDPNKAVDAGKACDGIYGPAKDICHGKIKSEYGRNYATLVAALEKSGATGKEAAAYAREPSWDRAFGALALLVACLVVAAMVVSMALLMLGAQGADAGAAPVVWVLAMLPGATRTLLWRWVGVLVSSALITFATAIGLPLFGIAAGALLSAPGPDVMVEHLLLLDAMAVAFFVLHKRIAGAATSMGQRIATRMQYARLSGMGLRGAGAALSLTGGSPFGARTSPGRGLLGEARGALRMGLAPVALAMRGAHAALIGPKPQPAGDRHPAARALAGAGGRAAAQGELQVDQWTGEVLHDPDTDRPLLASRVHAKASRLRGYRVAHRIGRAAYGSTLGLPWTLHRAKGRASEFTDDARQQLRVSVNRVREDAAGWEPVATGAATAGRAAGRTVRDGAIGAVIYTAAAPTARPAGRPTPHTRPDHPATAPTSPRPAPSTTAGNRGRTAGPSARPAPRRTPTTPPAPTPTPTPGSGSGSGSGRPTTSQARPRPSAGSTPAADAQDAANAQRLREAMQRRRRTVRGDQDGGTP